MSVEPGGEVWFQFEATIAYLQMDDFPHDVVCGGGVDWSRRRGALWGGEWGAAELRAGRAGCP